jgi:hypothetical protein
MLQQQNDLNNLISQIPQKYIESIIEYAKLMKLKAEKGEPSDTEYLEKIPGMVDSIIKESSKDLKKYKDKLKW